MAGAVGEIRIKGRAELEAAFMQMRREVLAELRSALRLIADKVKRESHTRSQADISNIGDRWSEFRIGTTIKGVYVAPKARRSGGSPRPNLGGLLRTAMQEALDANAETLRVELDALIDGAGVKAGL